MINVGLDFGTSNSSIARFSDGRIQLFPVAPKTISPNLLRSFIYVDREYEHFVGSRAIDQYLKHETGRPVFWETRPVGTIKNVWGGTPSTGGEPIFEERDVVAEQIQAVVRTGGSAEVPAFIRLLQNQFGVDRLRPLNPFETIVGGLAIRASERTAFP